MHAMEKETQSEIWVCVQVSVRCSEREMVMQKYLSIVRISISNSCRVATFHSQLKATCQHAVTPLLLFVRMDSYVDNFQAAGGSMVMLAKGELGTVRSRLVC